MNTKLLRKALLVSIILTVCVAFVALIAYQKAPAEVQYGSSCSICQDILITGNVKDLTRFWYAIYATGGLFVLDIVLGTMLAIETKKSRQ